MASPEPMAADGEPVPQVQTVHSTSQVPQLQPAPSSRSAVAAASPPPPTEPEADDVDPAEPTRVAEHQRKNSNTSKRSRGRNRSRARAGTGNSNIGGAVPPSPRPLNRSREDLYSGDPEDEDHNAQGARHPDRPPARSTRPPRAYLNHPAYAGLESPAKMTVEETKGAAGVREQYYTYDGGAGPETGGTTTRPGGIFYNGRYPHQQYDEEYGGYGPASMMTPGYGRGGTGLDGRFNADYPPRINWNQLSREERAEVLRIPWTQWMNSDFKNHFVATIGEFIGTTMFLLFAFAGTEVANTGAAGVDNPPFNVGAQMYISLAFGFSLMVNVWIFFRISGAQFNPAVTLAMLLVRAISAVRAACLFLGQIAGSLLASAVVRYLFPQPFAVRTSLSRSTSLAQGVFIEAVLTAELVFTIFMLAKEKHKANYMAPIGIGLALFIAEMAGVPYTGGSLNPARSFGPCVITGVFETEHWIYWLGPSIGAVIAVVFYQFIKILEYEMANPGADGDQENDPTKNPAKRAELMMNRKLSTRPPTRHGES
ncbi:aquaporin [Magnaporthiopsis poae ATCC 64411]|uniref:Aquaporin n=1 Tax=Magnaporthiopsis poae (strain ATCC 64411 / 73-15) TaxID=644358 RepID=A0A0C4EDZ7_MAGP6|nr:aquaporin [Magnaporthiopsis poae ATCC 64411]